MGNTQLRSMDVHVPILRELVHRKARQLRGRYGFTRDDVQDVQQELWLHLVRGMHRHDGARGSPHALAVRIVVSKLATILAHRCAGKRDRRRVREGVILGQLPGRSDETQAADSRLDLHQAMESMPPEQRRVALLLRCHNLGDAARRCGMTRQQARTQQRRIQLRLMQLDLAPESRPRATKARAAAVVVPVEHRRAHREMAA